LELDPFFSTMHVLNVVYYYHEGKFKESLNAYMKLLEINPVPTMPGMYQYGISLKLGEDMLAVEIAQKELPGTTKTTSNPDSVKKVYNESGFKGLLNWLIELELGKLKPDPYILAYRFSLRGDQEEALYWLEKAYDEHYPELPRINNCPDYNFIRSEPRFQALIKKMGLSEYQQRK